MTMIAMMFKRRGGNLTCFGLHDLDPHLVTRMVQGSNLEPAHACMYVYLCIYLYLYIYIYMIHALPGTQALLTFSVIGPAVWWSFFTVRIVLLTSETVLNCSLFHSASMCCSTLRVWSCQISWMLFVVPHWVQPGHNYGFALKKGRKEQSSLIWVVWNDPHRPCSFDRLIGWHGVFIYICAYWFFHIHVRIFAHVRVVYLLTSIYGRWCFFSSCNVF